MASTLSGASRSSACSSRLEEMHLAETLSIAAPAALLLPEASTEQVMSWLRLIRFIAREDGKVSHTPLAIFIPT